MNTAQDAAGDRFAPPQAHVEDVPPPAGDEPVLAGRWSRFWAAMIDGGIGFAVFGLVAWLSPWNPWRASGVAGFAANALVGFVSFLVLQGWLLAHRGQTIGKAALGVRIVRTDGSRASAWQLIGLRYGINAVITAIPLIGGIYALADCLFIFRESRRCLHDQIAGTIVVTA